MRLTTVILIASLMQVSAAGFAQKISLSKKNASLKTVIKELRLQSGYDFVYNDKALNAAKPVSINVKDAKIEDVLEQIFATQKLTYSIDSKTVIIKELETTLLDNVKDKIASFFEKDSVVFKGKVVDEKGLPMPGANVKIKETNKGTIATSQGAFVIYVPAKGSTLIISYIGYVTKEITLAGLDANAPLVVNMVPGQNQLGEVNVVSNGYQDIPKERATGSFEVITKEQLQHSNNPNLLRRLEGITSSVNFLNNSQFYNINSVKTQINPLYLMTIRGRNTLNGTGNDVNPSGSPLVVIDGVASPYDISKVNPNDVENITILRDAAAASIWGSRAANGVIVIKTKRGSFNRPLNISFNANVNITDKLDLFYKPMMSASDFIDAEVLQYGFLFGTSAIPAPNFIQAQRTYSPVFEIISAQYSGAISPDQAKTQIDALRKNDVRKDFEKYIMRKAMVQNYTLEINSGSEKIAQRLSANYDKTLNNVINIDQNRLALAYNLMLKPTKNLELNGVLSYTRENADNQSAYSSIGENPNSMIIYSRLADDQGNPLSTIKTYRPAFLSLLNQRYGNKLLSFEYKPLEDVNEGYNKTITHNINLNLVSNYQLSPIFSANLTYNYNSGFGQQNELESENSFYMRDLINRYTVPIDYVDYDPYRNILPLTRQVPLGAYYVRTATQSSTQDLRGLISAHKTWNGKHELSVSAGADIAESIGSSHTNGSLGFNTRTQTSVGQLNYVDYLPQLFADALNGFNTNKIDVPDESIYLSRIRTLGLLSNAAYTYDRRYTLSASVRKDLSSEFGVGTNKKGNVFYSFGGSWAINNESFYNINWLPQLKLRATFGYNGNVNPQIIANASIYHNPISDYRTGFYVANASASNVTNSNLRAERTGMLNLGLDFGFRGGRLSGSLEFYQKNTSDLLSGSSVDPTLGYSTLTINNGNLKGQGVDLKLNSLNLQRGLFTWNSSFMVSWNRVKVTKLYAGQATNAGGVVLNTNALIERYDLSQIFAFRWAGLNPQTGDPMGYLNGEAVSISSDSKGTENYSKILSAPISTAHYFGSAVPVYLGSFGNVFSYGSFSISANIIYKLGYYFKRTSQDILRYSALLPDAFSSPTIQSAEYAQRWQKPGDELITNVPSLTFPVSSQRDLFYARSEINVQKADHIRLQEVNLSYAFNKAKGFIKNPRLYVSLPVNVILWRANNLGLDPDSFDYPRPKTYGIGFSANF